MQLNSLLGFDDFQLFPLCFQVEYYIICKGHFFSSFMSINLFLSYEFLCCLHLPGKMLNANGDSEYHCLSRLT